MPNYTWNTIKANKDVIKSLLTDEGNFDFNKFIPIPEELRNTTAGGRVEFLMGLHLIKNKTKEEFFECIHKYYLYNCFNKKATKKEIQDYYEERLFGCEKRDGEYVDVIKDGYSEDSNVVAMVTGKDYCDMHDKYGCHDWYEWANRHWGTKWNAFDVEVDDDEISFTTAWCHPEPILNKICELHPKAKIEFSAEYEDNYYMEGSNHKGEFCIDKEFEKDLDNIDEDEEDCEYEDLPWIEINTGEVLYV